MHSSAPKFDQPLHLHPIVRGYWTDSEMFKVTGANSIGVAKGMQRKGMLNPGRYVNESGKLSRAWLARDLFRIAAAVDLAEETGFSIAAAIVMVEAIGVDIIDQALSTAETIKLIQTTFENEKRHSKRIARNGLPPGWAAQTIIVERPSLAELLIVNRTYLYLLANEGMRDGPPFQMQPVGVLTEIRSNNPAVSAFPNDLDHHPIEAERSELRVILGTLATRPLEHAFGPAIQSTIAI